jgi:hypothetical protein
LSAFRRHGITPPGSATDSDIDSASPAMRALEKTVVEEDIVVEIEIDSIADTEPGSMYSIPSIQSAKIMGEEQDDRGGLASFTPSGSMTATAVGRMLGSRTGRKLIERVGVNPEQADVVQLIGEMAIGFSAGGPAGAIVPLARRGGRDAGEKALEVMVERGMIDQSVADKIIKHGLNRIASEGLPDEIIQAAEATRDRLLTEENRRKRENGGFYRFLLYKPGQWRKSANLGWRLRCCILRGWGRDGCSRSRLPRLGFCEEIFRRDIPSTVRAGYPLLQSNRAPAVSNGPQLSRGIHEHRIKAATGKPVQAH